jgi:hypothetical protein
VHAEEGGASSTEGDHEGSGISDSLSDDNIGELAEDFGHLSHW